MKQHSDKTHTSAAGMLPEALACMRRHFSTTRLLLTCKALQNLLFCKAGLDA